VYGESVSITVLCVAPFLNVYSHSSAVHSTPFFFYFVIGTSCPVVKFSSLVLLLFLSDDNHSRSLVSILEIRHIRSLRPRRFGAMQPAWQDTSCVLFATQRAAAVDFLALVRHLEDALAPAAKSLGFFLSFAYTRYPFLNSVHLVAPRRVSPAREFHNSSPVPTR
jgi:hypothetical protein